VADHLFLIQTCVSYDPAKDLRNAFWFPFNTQRLDKKSNHRPASGLVGDVGDQQDPPPPQNNPESPIDTTIDHSGRA
jgi:hypothetical protein